MVGLVGISSIHRFSHDFSPTSQALHKVCRCPRRRCRCLRVQMVGPKKVPRPRRKVWVVCVELSFFWVFGWPEVTGKLQIECPKQKMQPKELVWFFQEVLNLRKVAEQFATLLVFLSSKVVVQVFMMNDGSFSPKVSGLCSCAPILADARHRGWSGIDGCVKKN